MYSKTSSPQTSSFRGVNIANKKTIAGKDSSILPHNPLAYIRQDCSMSTDAIAFSISNTHHSFYTHKFTSIKLPQSKLNCYQKKKVSFKSLLSFSYALTTAETKKQKSFVLFIQIIHIG